MRILLDTHLILWALTGSPSLPEKAAKMILDEANHIYFSPVSVWEVSIKHSLSSAKMPVSGRDLLGYIQAAGYVELRVTSGHAVAVETLPHHHKDPFDRMLVAQSIVEPMYLLTHDSQLSKYGASVMTV